jgi:hypothetical protein
MQAVKKLQNATLTTSPLNFYICNIVAVHPIWKCVKMQAAKKLHWHLIVAR